MAKAILLALSLLLAFPALPSPGVMESKPAVIVRKEPPKQQIEVIKQINNVKVTGYYPLTCSKRERAIEGGKNDKFGNPIRVLRAGHAYVTVAVDHKVIPLKSYFMLDEFPNTIFYASDVGRRIKGRKIDIAVMTKAEAHQLPKYVIVKLVKL